MGEELYSLCIADGALAVVLDALQIVHGESAAEQGFGEMVCSGDGVLQGDVDADAADGGHGVGCVADAEQAGGAPLLKVVDLDSEELNFVPGVDLGGAACEEGDDALEALLEGGDAFLLNLREGAFGNEIADLKIIIAIDEDDETAEVEVAERVLWIGGLACDAEPKDVYRNAFI